MDATTGSGYFRRNKHKEHKWARRYAFSKEVYERECGSNKDQSAQCAELRDILKAYAKKFSIHKEQR